MNFRMPAMWRLLATDGNAMAAMSIAVRTGAQTVPVNAAILNGPKCGGFQYRVNTYFGIMKCTASNTSRASSPVQTNTRIASVISLPTSIVDIRDPIQHR